MPPLTIFLTTWNTGLQGSKAQPQDLTSWLLPILHQTANDPSASRVVPDLYVIGVQELLPLELALGGFTHSALRALTDRIQHILTSHAKTLSDDEAEEYFLVERVSHVGVAMWVFARESTLSGKLGKSLKATLGLWWGGMGNKGAVGIRLPVRRGDEGSWETMTFVCAHLEAHDHNISRRNQQYQNILSCLIFRPSDRLEVPKQIHQTSHLFVLGDLNYRLERIPSTGWPREGEDDEDALELEKERAAMIQLDTLRKEQKAGRVFGGLREPDLSGFAPTYKRVVGKVEGYSNKRIPGWTDRILFASHTDPLSLYSSQYTVESTPVPEYTTQIAHFNATSSLTLSDHKPVHAILILPHASHSAPAPHLAPELPETPPPHPPRPAPTPHLVVLIWKALGTTLDRAIGWPWFVLSLGTGSLPMGGAGLFTLVAMVWGVYSYSGQ
ncbi:hypothetical protein M231_02590 [Tremella mesenterica]|uniref:Inositol polyphosphate-related phosphatase domain-containing protein n=1 Tax=Tremella mesenterica TaxID=5217 RepID=A0A4Q1BQD6_TREME|nr:uncharacterized protein TREMEDRAFT_38385 [Tremella mesenterica DSM 1558]EIW70756.1 hypothetical protein TREMEDRAFT_38385 [Tremella mesenterica DSM 1558]RXK40133.1 hypothetical protein M231_02590 [Tremella mesenterica]